MTAWIRVVVTALALTGFTALPACEKSAEDEFEDATDELEDAGDEMGDDLDDLGE